MKNKIIGQNKLTNELDKIFSIFKNSNGKIRPHFILTGSSGSGKTFTIQTMCKKHKIGFVEINSAQLTKEGMAGNSLSKALTPLTKLTGKPNIVFVDEFDKLFISDNSNSSSAHECTTGVQNEFLKVLESKTTSVFGDYGKYLNTQVDNCLFIFTGAFNGEENIDIDRLRELGLKTEFLGRVGLVYNTKKLSLEDLYSILENSELLDNYLKLFKRVSYDNVVTTLKNFIKSNYEFNTLGARYINTLINQYFIKGGKIGMKEIKEISFNSTLEL